MYNLFVDVNEFGLCQSIKQRKELQAALLAMSGWPAIIELNKCETNKSPNLF